VLVSNKKSALYLKSFFKQIGIQHIVICPGSRNLPLIVNFSNDNYFKTYSLIDERVAGFFALGIAKALKRPVAVLTTSGSAAINLAPAMAEAYYQRLPLIAITADRPPHFVNKGENQTIIQRGLFSNYIGLELEIQEKIDFETFENKIQELFRYLSNPNLSTNVHINLPFSEPLDKVENILGEFQLNLKPNRNKINPISAPLLKIKKRQNVIFYISTNIVNSELNEILDRGVKENYWVVISEMQSGWYNEDCISQIDLILSRDKDVQQPDILITIGETMLSKKFRTYIKTHEELLHYDISAYPRHWNNLSTQYQNINLEYSELHSLLNLTNSIEFQASWVSAEKRALDYQSSYHKELTYLEINLIHRMVNTIDQDSIIYWGNSSAVRYGNWSNWKNKPNITHQTNRGVAGIEGILATAIGNQAINKSESFYCILGDVSLLYETSSLAAAVNIDHINIIVLNNHGGMIFEQIHNSPTLGKMDALTTPHNQNFRKLANLYDLEYFNAYDLRSFTSQWEHVNAHQGKLIFEINISENEVGKWKDYFDI
jgi:2-succinyl-5-enolpyruvyl-6-hydroxy-3-cyclohexene-1-carboxylate synthase